MPKKVFAIAIFLPLLLAACTTVRKQTLQPDFQAVLGYRELDNREQLAVIDDQVTSAAGDPQQKSRLAEQFAVLLFEDSASSAAQRFALRHLIRLATPDQLEAVAHQLNDPVNSHLARWVLCEADSGVGSAILRRALPGATGQVKIGILQSLGELRDSASVKIIVKHWARYGAAEQQAALAALGRIATPEAIRALQEYAEKANASQLAAQQALVTAACQLAAIGQQSNAAEIFLPLVDGAASQDTRQAALVGLAASAPEQAIPLIVRRMRQPDNSDAWFCLRFVRTLQSADFSEQCAVLLARAPDDYAAAMLPCLLQRGDASTLPAIRSAASSSSSQVRAAAWQVLGRMGTEADLDLLLAACVKRRGEEQRTAREALGLLRGTDVDAALQSRYELARPEEKTEILRALGQRQSPQAMGLVELALAQPEPRLREAALETLGDVAREEHLPRLLDLLSRAGSNRERAIAERAIVGVLQQLPESGTRCAPVSECYKSAREDTLRASCLRVLGDVGEASALDLLREASRDDSPPVREAAIRSLAGWKNHDPAAELWKLTETAPAENLRLLCLQAYIRMIADDSDPVEKLKNYNKALKGATRNEEKILILSGLGRLKSQRAFAALEPWLQQPDLSDEAAAALTTLAWDTRAENRAASTEQMKRALAAARSEPVRRRASELLKHLEDGIL